MHVYCSDHASDVPGCKTVLVLDGNMKNAREVCMCKSVGELKFSDLKGSVVIGINDNSFFFVVTLSVIIIMCNLHEYCHKPTSVLKLQPGRRTSVW